MGLLAGCGGLPPEDTGDETAAVGAVDRSLVLRMRVHDGTVREVSFHGSGEIRLKPNDDGTVDFGDYPLHEDAVCGGKVCPEPSARCHTVDSGGKILCACQHQGWLLLCH